MSTDSVKELRENILKGIEMSFEKLLKSKKKEDADLVFSRNGKVIRIKANDIE
jgi:hypothetical protein